MAACSVTTTLVPSLTISTSQSHVFKSGTATKLSSFPLPSFSSSNSLKTLKPSVPSRRVFAAPEVLGSAETVDPPAETLDVPDSETSEIAPKNKIRIKLKSYWVPLIEDSCKQILNAASTTNAKTMGPVPLPTRIRKYCVLKSPHVNKDARFQFEIRTHQRMIDIIYPTAQTIDSLMQLDLPAGVDVEVKL